ncbi:MAG: sensor histidine kinase [Faecalibacterium prausnitzii]
MKLLNRSLIVYPEQNGDLGSEQVFGIDGEVPRNIFSAPEERDAANWTFANKKRSGAGTDSYPDAKGLYLALRTGGGVFGVIGIDLSEKPLDAFENSVLLSILGEGALAIENRRNALEKEQAALQARNEELRANLLRTISHDLRTPLTSISGNASNLLSNGETLDTETRTKICTDIFDDAQWLIGLVENLAFHHPHRRWADESADLAAADGRNDRRSTASCQPEKLRTHHHNTVWGRNPPGQCGCTADYAGRCQSGG